MPQQKTAYQPTPTITTSVPQPSGSTTVEDIDTLLDDIDACLEENTLEVVRAYVQRPGQ